MVNEPKSSSWVKEYEMDYTSKTKKCITETKIIFGKLISVPARLFDSREYGDYICQDKTLFYLNFLLREHEQRC